MTPPFSARERQVLDRILRGDCAKRAAQALRVSPKTTAKHLERMRRKLNLRSTNELRLWGILSGQTPVPESVRRLLPTETVTADSNGR